MIEGEVTSRRALRDAYRDAIAKELEARELTLSSGEFDGVPVVTVKNIEEAIALVFAGPPPGTPDGFAEVATPANVLVHAECPRCGIPAEINVVMGAVLTVDQDGAELSAKAKSKARTHICGQLPLALGEKSEGEQESIDFDSIVGPTREETIARRDAEPPDDLLDPDDDATCGAEVAIPLVEGEGPTESGMLELVCHRAIDHDGDHFDRRDDVAWHFETVPVPQGVEGNEDAPVGPAEEGDRDGEAND